MLEKFAYFVNIKTILGTSPDSYRRLVGSDLGSKCFARVICGNLFLSLSEQTDLLKLYARQAKIK